MSDHAQKKFDVYVDGNSDLVDSDSSKTIVRFDDKMTVADVAKAVEEFINKEYPPKKAAPAVDYKTDTRTIVTTDDEKAKELKNKYHGKGTKVRIMKRKSANKVYIDSKTPEIHKAINDALADELSESKGFEPPVNEEKIDNYVASLAKKYNGLKTINPNSKDWKDLVKQLSNLSDEDLKKVVDAKIKWASMMAEPMLKYGKHADKRHGGKK